jgi:hypothetical protein
LFVAAFQVALVLGAPWGEYTPGGGTSGLLPASGQTVAALSCLLSILMAGAILARAGEGPLTDLGGAPTWTLTNPAKVPPRKGLGALDGHNPA